MCSGKGSAGGCVESKKSKTIKVSQKAGKKVKK